MGMLFKTPKIPKAPTVTNQALDSRETRAEAEERRQLKSAAARRVAMRKGGMKGLLSPENENALLGVPTTLVQEDPIRNPYNMTSKRGPTV